MASDAPRTHVVIPALDEARSIADVVTAARTALPHAVVVVVDDGSGDSTSSTAQRAGAVVLRHPYICGTAAAEQTGVLYAMQAGAAAVLRLDGDGQHDPVEGAALLEPVQAGEADCVVGVRFGGTGGDRSTRPRRAGGAWLSWAVRAKCGRRFSDPTSGFRAYGPRAMQEIAIRPAARYAEVLDLPRFVRAGLRVIERPVAMRARTAGRSSISGPEALVYVADVTLSVFLSVRSVLPAAAELRGET